MSKNTHKMIVINSEVNVESYQIKLRYSNETKKSLIKCTGASGSFKAGLEVACRAVDL